MGTFDWFVRKHESRSYDGLTQGARDFLAGKTNILTSADVDPEGAKKLAGYQKAMALKKAGRLFEAAEILQKSCNPPSIYKGHYRELFRIWRQFNRTDITGRKYNDIVDRVLTMIRYDGEMVHEMLRYWSIQRRQELPFDSFDRDKNLLVSDAKALKKAAEELQQDNNVQIATKLIESFGKTRKV